MVMEVEVKRKWWALAQPPYSPLENVRQSPGRKPTSDRTPYAENTQKTGIIKGWEAKQDHERISDTFSYN